MRHQRRMRRRKTGRIMTAVAAIVAVAAVAVAGVLHDRSADPARALPIHLPATPLSYLGVYANSAPVSYAGLTAFTNTTGVEPDVVMYYSGWFQSFPNGFASTAARNGAVPLVQIDPTDVNVAKIASGQYDGYLSSYAVALRSYRHPVILSFGHEMNGDWYSWGYRRTSPAAFVAAWRHIVTLFRALGARNITWLWTINVESSLDGPIQDWWPGKSYVTWVGIDGYYYSASYQFASLFGPTITAVREMTRDPILLAETGAAPSAGQPAKVADLFAGIRTYGLLGFVWFDVVHIEDWRLNTSAAIAAFRQGAKTFTRPAS